jgi:hypothetical protein
MGRHLRRTYLTTSLPRLETEAVYIAPGVFIPKLQESMTHSTITARSELRLLSTSGFAFSGLVLVVSVSVFFAHSFVLIRRQRVVMYIWT